MNEQRKTQFRKIKIGIKWTFRKFKRFLKKVLRFLLALCLKLPYWLRMGIFVLGMLAVGVLGGYKVGMHRATREAVKVERKLVSQHDREKEALQEELKNAQIKNPEVRPWYLTLVNDMHPMEEGYVPKLVDVGNGHQVDERIAASLKKMMKDAEKAGLHPMICSSYRTIEYQQKLYDEYMAAAVKEGMNYWEALRKTETSTAYPGRSEHNIGLAVDIVSASYTQLDKQQEQTPEAKWLAENCYKYGFILRYPNGKTDITGIIYEPWHYRYVGQEDAKKIKEMGITLEEYLGED